MLRVTQTIGKAHATGCTDDRQTCMLSLHTAGEAVQDVFATLADTGVTYDEAVAALNAHFQLQVNVTFQRHVFHRKCQESHKTVSQFVVRLWKLSQQCEFGAETAFICDQVVNKCISKKPVIRFWFRKFRSVSASC